MRIRYSTGFDNCSKQILSHTISSYAYSVLTSFVNETVDFNVYFLLLLKHSKGCKDSCDFSKNDQLKAVTFRASLRCPTISCLLPRLRGESEVL